MTSRALLVAIAMLASMAVPPVPASDGFGCPKPPMGTGWRTPGAECRTRLQGLPLTVYGSAIGPGAWVHVSLVVPTFTDVVVVECSATDASDPPADNKAECSNVVVADEDVLVAMPEITVRCRVEGKTSSAPALPGGYFCQTGSTLPPL
jgi:hypothetical protein